MNGLEMNEIAGWSSPVARRAHNPKVASSNLAPATKSNGGYKFCNPFSFASGKIGVTHYSRRKRNPLI